MDGIIKELINYGALGLMCAVLIYNVIFLQKKVISIVENNTKAFDELKAVIENYQLLKRGE